MTKLLDAPERPVRTGGPTGPRPVASSIARRIRNLLTSPKYGPVTVTAVLFVAIFIIGGVRYRGFFSGQVFLNLLVDNSYLIVLAVGMTFVILTGGIDLSVGAVVALSGMIAASLLQTGWSPAVVIPLILVLTSVLGLLVGLMIHIFKVQPFIATLAAMFLARGLCYVISQSSISITDATFVQLAVTRIPLGGNLSITPSVIIAVVVVAIAVWVLHATRFGRTVYAIGGGEQSGLLMGLPVARTKVLVYVISGLLLRPRRRAVHLLHAVGVSAHRDRHRARRDRRGRHRRHAAHRRLRVRARIGARRAGARRDPDDHHVRGHALVVVDEDLHRRAAAGVHHPAEGAHRQAALSRIGVGRGLRDAPGQDNRRNERARGREAGAQQRVSDRDDKARVATIFDVARLAGVSHQTVSRVLNDLPNVRPATRARVEQAIKQLRYVPSPAARALVTRRTRTLGLIVTGAPDYGPSSTALHFNEAARDARYSVITASMLETDAPSMRSAAELLVRQNVEAIVLIAAQRAALDALDGVELGVPIIAVASEDRGGMHRVWLDQYAGRPARGRPPHRPRPPGDPARRPGRRTRWMPRSACAAGRPPSASTGCPPASRSSATGRPAAATRTDARSPPTAR